MPLAVLAGLLFIVAYNMGEWHEIPSLLKMTKADIVGVARHVRADGRRRSDGGGRSGDGAGGAAVHPPCGGHDIGRARDRRRSSRKEALHSLQGVAIPALRRGVSDSRAVSVRIDRQAATESAIILPTLPPIVIVRLRHVPAMDASGLQALEDLADQVRLSGRTLLLMRGARAAGASDANARSFTRTWETRIFCRTCARR